MSLNWTKRLITFSSGQLSDQVIFNGLVIGGIVYQCYSPVVASNKPKPVKCSDL